MQGQVTLCLSVKKDKISSIAFYNFYNIFKSREMF